MEPLALAKNLYRREAGETVGVSATELARRLDDRSRALREMQRETADRIGGILEPGKREAGEKGAAASHEVLGAIRDALAEQPGEMESLQDVSMDATADHLEQAADDIRGSVGKSGAIHKELPEGVAGQAMLGREGTATFDAESLVGGERVVDRDMAEGVAAHEQFHTEQEAPDAAEVTLKDGTRITDHEFIEAGAIAAQEEVNPQSVERLSDDYKAIRGKVGSLLSPDRLVELSRRGKMRQFAAEASLAA